MVSSCEIGHNIATNVRDNASTKIKAFNFSLPGDVENVYQTSPDDDESNYTNLETVDTNQSTDFECFLQHTACYEHVL